MGQYDHLSWFVRCGIGSVLRVVLFIFGILSLILLVTDLMYISSERAYSFYACEARAIKASEDAPDVILKSSLSKLDVKVPFSKRSLVKAQEIKVCMSGIGYHYNTIDQCTNTEPKPDCFMPTLDKVAYLLTQILDPQQ